MLELRTDGDWTDWSDGRDQNGAGFGWDTAEDLLAEAEREAEDRENREGDPAFNGAFNRW